MPKVLDQYIGLTPSSGFVKKIKGMHSGFENSKLKGYFDLWDRESKKARKLLADSLQKAVASRKDFKTLSAGVDIYTEIYRFLFFIVFYL